jgi:hypothetical protein
LARILRVQPRRLRKQAGQPKRRLTLQHLWQDSPDCSVDRFGASLCKHRFEGLAVLALIIHSLQL